MAKEEKECFCQTFWDKDGDYEIGDYTCDPCLLEQDACFCSKYDRCHLCDMRTPLPLTFADKERADTNLAKVREDFREQHKKWHADKEAGALHEENTYYCLAATWGAETAWGKECGCKKCIFSGSPELDLSLGRDHQRLRIALRLREEHDYYEMTQWFDSWAAKTPLHLDSSAWHFRETLRLTWAARKLDGI